MTGEWLPNKSTAVYLVAVDIVGFSKRLANPTALLSARTDLFHAIENTPFFHAHRTHSIKSHFLGDELRLAVLASATSAAEVLDFTCTIFRNLNAMSVNPTSYGLEAVATVLSGYVQVLDWRGCRFIEGPVAFKAQRWMGMKLLEPGEVATDEDFDRAGGEPKAGWRFRQFSNDRGWVRRCPTASRRGQE